MGRVHIVNEIHKNKDFFCEKWVEFCQWVEKCAKQLEKYQKEHTAEQCRFMKETHWLEKQYKVASDRSDKKAVNGLKKAIDSNQIKQQKIESKMKKREQQLEQKGWIIWHWDMLCYLNVPMKHDYANSKRHEILSIPCSGYLISNKETRPMRSVSCAIVLCCPYCVTKAGD